MDFDKPALSIAKQRELLTDRGLKIPDDNRADIYLTHTNYYRLSAYCIPYQEASGSHNFIPDANLDRVLSDYEFDRALRLLLLDAIERIEVSVRTQWAYFMAHKFGPHGYTQWNQRIYKSQPLLLRDLRELEKHVVRSKEPFVKHLLNKYSEELPPCWAGCEVMSLGLLSKFYSNLGAYGVRRDIASTYGFDEGFLEGYLEHLSYVRNVCAHHSRLWNRHLTKKMPLPKGKPRGLSVNIFVDENNNSEHRIYNTLVVVTHMLSVICGNEIWISRLKALVDEFDVNVRSMGFPPDWRDRPIWLE